MTKILPGIESVGMSRIRTIIGPAAASRVRLGSKGIHDIVNANPVTPPFKGRPVSGAHGMAAAKAAARREELAMKRMKAHSKRRIGPLTEVEYVDDLFGRHK